MEDLKSNIALLESYGSVSPEINSLKERVLKIVMELSQLKQQQTEACREESINGQITVGSKRPIGQISSPSANFTQGTTNQDAFTLPSTSGQSRSTPSPAFSLRNNSSSDAVGNWAEQAQKRIAEQLLHAPDDVLS